MQCVFYISFLTFPNPVLRYTLHADMTLNARFSDTNLVNKFGRCKYAQHYQVFGMDVYLDKQMCGGGLLVGVVCYV